MRGRKYTDLIQIFTVTNVSDGFGGYVPEETLVKETWANISTKGAGFKFQQYGLNDFKAPVIFAIRGKQTFEIDEKSFIRFKGRRFEIKGVEDVDLESTDWIIYADEA